MTFRPNTRRYGTLATEVLVLLTACSRTTTPDVTPRPVTSELPAPSASAKPVKPDPTLAPTDCPTGMAGIPGGTLRSYDGGDAIQIAPFCMDKLEVTVARFKKCVDAGKCAEPQHFAEEGTNRFCNWKHPGKPRDEYPINCLTADTQLATRAKALEFCTFEGKTIPSDAQWEWAARGGAYHWKYPWGDARPTQEQANLGGNRYCSKRTKLPGSAPQCGIGAEGEGLDDYGEGHFNESAPVGSLPKGANPWGVLDLIGNVAEITSGDVETGSPAFSYEERFTPRIRGGWYGANGWNEIEPPQKEWLSKSDMAGGIRCVAVPVDGKE